MYPVGSFAHDQFRVYQRPYFRGRSESLSAIHVCRFFAPSAVRLKLSHPELPPRAGSESISGPKAKNRPWTPEILSNYCRPVRQIFARLTLDVFNLFLKLSRQNTIGSRSELHTTFCVDRLNGPTILRWLSICRLGHCGGPGGRKPLSENGLSDPEAG